jgi:hypothetical protein
MFNTHVLLFLLFVMVIVMINFYLLLRKKFTLLNLIFDILA